ncbi:hypothetical protein NPIL_694451 [Nephila pilipes]|uniref:Uncharacterized protein n=1 Tax=Nephila pilipes TaxID=299642 RepID=A0A8X6NWQ1_NEPPI|nr:hypothetical protein NPIL_694451 [Nephila pilipes]
MTLESWLPHHTNDQGFKKSKISDQHSCRPNHLSQIQTPRKLALSGCSGEICPYYWLRDCCNNEWPFKHPAKSKIKGHKLQTVGRDDGPICCEKQVEDAVMPWSEELPRHQPQYQSDILTAKSYLRDITG